MADSNLNMVFILSNRIASRPNGIVIFSVECSSRRSDRVVPSEVPIRS